MRPVTKHLPRVTLLLSEGKAFKATKMGPSPGNKLQVKERRAPPVRASARSSVVGFQGGGRALLPDRKVLLGMTRLQNTLELSWSISSHYFLRLSPGIQFLQDLLPYRV